jgi:hypothetical protein
VSLDSLITGREEEIRADERRKLIEEITAEYVLISKKELK